MSASVVCQPTILCSEARIVGSKERAATALRKVGARNIGGLVRIRGMVTRVTEVKPLMIVAAYTCSDCETSIYQVGIVRNLHALLSSLTIVPTIGSARQAIHADHPVPFGRVPEEANQRPTASTHASFEVHQVPRSEDSRGKCSEHKGYSTPSNCLSQLAEEVPMGHVPTGLLVHARGEATRQCGPGDVVTIWGVFLPTPASGEPTAPHFHLDWFASTLTSGTRLQGPSSGRLARRDFHGRHGNTQT